MNHCLECNKTLECNHKTRQKKYCSLRCQSDHQYIIRWLDGKEKGLKGAYQTSNHIRKWLLEQRGEKCWQCGWDKKHPSDGRVPIELDHIDGDHTNNDPNNLRLLCPNCHSLTPTYKNRNNGNGRHERRERYKRGESY